jgi:hypothetical protein
MVTVCEHSLLAIPHGRLVFCEKAITLAFVSSALFRYEGQE